MTWFSPQVSWLPEDFFFGGHCVFYYFVQIWIQVQISLIRWCLVVAAAHDSNVSSLVYGVSSSLHWLYQARGIFPAPSYFFSTIAIFLHHRTFFLHHRRKRNLPCFISVFILPWVYIFLIIIYFFPSSLVVNQICLPCADKS